MLNLELLKSDRQLLLSELGLEKEGTHCKCPFHEDRTGSMIVREVDGMWYWTCKAGCGEGSFIDAFRMTHKLNTKNEALKEIEKQFGMKFGVADKKQRDPIPPILDLERAEKFIAFAHDKLLNDIDVQMKWMTEKRKIDLFTVEKFRLGFVTNFKFTNWPNWNLPAAWVLPITNAASASNSNGALMGVKLHFEIRPDLRDVPGGGPKSLWCPFSVVKDKEGRLINNGYPCLWPPVPPVQDVWINGAKREQEWMYVVPGELKALARIAANYRATSPTAGESQRLPDKEMTRLKGHRISIVFDGDEAGQKWRDAMIERCKPLAQELRVWSHSELN